MLKELLEYIFESADDRAVDRRANIVPFLSNERTTVYEHNGTIGKQDVPPPLRKHAVDSVDDLILATLEWGTKGTIWISHGRITLVINDEDRREVVCLALVQTDVFTVIKRLVSESRMDQANLIRLLRREFRNSPQQGIVLAAVRKIKFRSATSAYGNIEHGNESMGKEIEAEVTGIGADIPESLTLPLCVYGNPGERDNVVTIAFDLDIDVHQQKFSLKPMPDEVVFAVDQSLSDIRKRIIKGVGVDVPVLYGTP